MISKIAMIAFFAAFALAYVGLPYMGTIAAIMAGIAAVALAVER